MKRYGYFAVGLLAITAIAAVAVLGFDVSHLAHSNHLIHTAEFGALLGADAPKELKAVFDRIGEAFKTFKDTHDEELKGIKKGFADVVTADKLAKVQEALDKGVEAKAALDAAVAAEKKHVDEIERKLNKLGLSNNEEGRNQLELKTFNTMLQGDAAEKKRAFSPLDQAGYDAYKAAFNSMLRKNDKLLTPEEAKTLSVGSDPDGGYLVTPDTTGQIVKKVYETSPVRQYANVVTISTDALEGVEDLGEAGAGYAGEQAQGSDSTTPQIGKWRIPVFNMDTEPKATQNLLDDAAVDVEAWLGGKVANKRARFENNEFVTGAAAKIRGFVLGYPPLTDSGAGVAWGSIGYVATGVSADFAASAKGDKLYDLMGMLKNDYLPGAAWFAKRLTITAIRKFKDGQNNYLWQPSFIAGQPETIMGYPVARMEDMPTMAADSFSLAFANLKEAYTIVDRQGIRVLRDPYTAKPYVKFYTTWRTGGGVVNSEAIKLMKFGTS
jgi:HK97 family phage major capsid protein